MVHPVIKRFCEATKKDIKVSSSIILFYLILYLLYLGIIWSTIGLNPNMFHSEGIKAENDNNITISEHSKSIPYNPTIPYLKKLRNVLNLKYYIESFRTIYLGLVVVRDDPERIETSEAIMSCIVSVTFILLWTFLLIGAKKDNKCLVLIWLIVTMIHLMVISLANIRTSFILIYSNSISA